mmetsp:Transcript_26521/g.67922  ORF Transcript_26521/g.67922 Transcript_26521/m.67922 type:complete len:232 (-) Transcript_26521:3011-3706(-)
MQRNSICKRLHHCTQTLLGSQDPSRSGRSVDPVFASQRTTKHVTTHRTYRCPQTLSQTVRTSHKTRSIEFRPCQSGPGGCYTIHISQVKCGKSKGESFEGTDALQVILVAMHQVGIPLSCVEIYKEVARVRGQDLSEFFFVWCVVPFSLLFWGEGGRKNGKPSFFVWLFPFLFFSSFAHFKKKHAPPAHTEESDTTRHDTGPRLTFSPFLLFPPFFASQHPIKNAPFDISS